ncbi:MAG: DUF177 domain-containing protein [Pseudomonadota bacterium]
MSTLPKRVIDVGRLGSEERVRLVASEADRAAIAKELGIVAVKSLSADLCAQPWRGRGVRLTGTIIGEVVQECVVTLEPVEGSVNEPINASFHPDAAQRSTVDIDPEAEDPPDPLEGRGLELWSVVVEHFALGLDPYPRAPGAAFQDEVDEEAEPSPFAALAVLKHKSH